ncbi:MAG: hypothetical protein EP312_08195 [Gammaproteobacteria bacterium]|nr:MAG: hypothetical protein EP312_08195 [Gammaproteobacteria bacterium]
MRIVACLTLPLLLALAACGQKGPLVQPGEGPENTQYIIKGSDRPASPAPAPAHTTEDASDHD